MPQSRLNENTTSIEHEKQAGTCKSTSFHNDAAHLFTHLIWSSKRFCSRCSTNSWPGHIFRSCGLTSANSSSRRVWFLYYRPALRSRCSRLLMRGCSCERLMRARSRDSSLLCNWAWCQTPVKYDSFSIIIIPVTWGCYKIQVAVLSDSRIRVLPSLGCVTPRVFNRAC